MMWNDPTEKKREGVGVIIIVIHNQHYGEQHPVYAGLLPTSGSSFISKSCVCLVLFIFVARSTSNHHALENHKNDTYQSDSIRLLFMSQVNPTAVKHWRIQQRQPPHPQKRSTITFLTSTPRKFPTESGNSTTTIKNDTLQ
mmetsp:Transcript_36733/g.39868  ORF Transcript_36733/g.39868 Transcript_36733/m.39868 type:complete len:141 (+) Transcript_36733:120-542(+)